MSVNKAIKDGHGIANKIRAAKTISEINALSDDIRVYSSFVNNEFGVADDFDEYGEKYCDLVFYINKAANIKKDCLHYYPGDSNAGNEGVDDFEYYLDSMKWLFDS